MKKTTLSINGQPIYVTASGKVRVGTKGSATEVSKLYGTMDKGAARKLRKVFRDGGMVSLAAAPRLVA